MELAFEHVGLPIRWEGPKGVEEVGVLARGLDAGRVLVTICADFFRPVEVKPAAVPAPMLLPLSPSHPPRALMPGHHG